jgi:demethylmenaquinone methyltransferase / 2-methoxy-6-polyprenyl-1,4-benzoquinol methylase
LHRIWKRFARDCAMLRPGEAVLDVASGSGDLAKLYADEVQVKQGKGRVVMTDINAAMLAVGRDRMLNAGYLLETVQCDAEALPFADNTFDFVSVGFGLRNMTHKDQALAEMTRVLKPGGRLIVLEFSKVAKPLEKLYDAYSFNVLPVLGRVVAKDEASYRYLAESIRMHPDQETLKGMMEAVGLKDVRYFNLTAGICAVHRGYKL